MHKLSIIIQCIVIFFISSTAYSFSSSSYLIANSAMSFFDYEEANTYYENSDIENFNDSDLEKKLLAYVNTNALDKASKIAKEILRNDNSNQDAWLVYLTYAKLNNINKPFYELKKQHGVEELSIIKFVFYNNYQIKRNNDDIAQSLLDIVQASNANNNELQGLDYLLFYLSLSLNLNPKFNESFFITAQLYQMMKNYEKAEKFYNKVHKDHNLYLESQKNIANNKKHQNNTKKAEEELISLIDLYPSNKNLFVSLADFYKSTKQYKRAIPYYSIVLNIQDLDEDQRWRLLYMRGICYERINNWESAEEDFLKSLDINPESPQVLNYLAYSWIEKNVFLNESLKMLKRAYEKNPKSHYILDSLAWAHFKKKNLKIASQLMEEVIIRAPGEAISLDHLGDIYFAMGRRREALYMWRQAKDLAEPEDNIIDKILIKLKKYDAG
ncbi:MAG: tetratricopeptide repeat protein [Pelagibacteraceae bacterium]|nr:tetratricopeptide repeat protein [Pelagibacteraceae bacterium]MDP6785163.1 tetratricopeptide repeat protein [Alphaproteobacteria bacterium]MBO6467037.1 tetratricopeptide repeat protein [Pelagibacteraceae bacterium]MBO6467202.1 tetratricopeptide repeat protein [Pelagibacteraceae bacterium]MBO6470591.1 tetratricopeptide repeat protein [Pelagibacteraceae bacterium]